MTVSSPAADVKRGVPFLLFHFGRWILPTALISLFLWHAFVPAWRNLNSDFPNYYLAGKLARSRTALDRIYEWTWFQRQNDRLGVRPGLVGFAPNPPACALPVAPLTVFPPLTAKRIWLLLNLSFLAATIWILKKVTLLGLPWLISISFLCIVPLHSNFLLGQYYVLLLLLLCAGYYFSVRGKHFVSGAFIGIAAALKLFPAPFLLFFLWKRNWSAVAGFIGGSLAVVSISVATLGWTVHSVFLSEILPQVSRGDWLAPYDLWRNSFTTLWSNLFLYEPQLNVAPLVNSAAFYVVAMSATTTALLVAFGLTCSPSKKKSTSPVEWAAIISLCLLLSTTTGSYHPTLLILAAVITADTLWQANTKLAVALCTAYFFACMPIPLAISTHVPVRLTGIVSFYGLLLYGMQKHARIRSSRRVLFIAASMFLVCLAVNSRSIRYRSQDFASRLQRSPFGVRTYDAVSTAGQMAFIDMQQRKYAAVTVRDGDMQELSVTSDVLSLAGSNASDSLYAEVAGPRSRIFRTPYASTIDVGSPFIEGHDPALSADGRWLAFLRDERGQPEVWITQTTFSNQLVLPASNAALEISVSSAGDVFAAVGPADSPHLMFVSHHKYVEPMNIIGAVRFPAISPDGGRLAFSRRQRGSWHLFVRDLSSGMEQQLTYAACNATSPSWENGNSLLYATDCGRGVGLTAVARVCVR